MNRIIFLLLFFVSLAVSLLRAIPATDRSVIVSILNQYADAVALWGEYYSYGPIDSNYWRGQSEGIDLGAAFVETSPETESYEVLLARLYEFVQVELLWAEHYALNQQDIAWYMGRAHGLLLVISLVEARATPRRSAFRHAQQ